jgi:hypothetical protein
MDDLKVETPDDPCPLCGGAFTIDPAQDPDTLIDRHSRNADKPYEAMRYAEKVRAKAAEHGVIHRCRDCGYRARLPPPAEPDADTGADAGASARPKLKKKSRAA